MNNLLDSILFSCCEINELQMCLMDVLENSMSKDEIPYYSTSLLSLIVKKSTELYKSLDEYSLNITD